MEGCTNRLVKMVSNGAWVRTRGDGGGGDYGHRHCSSQLELEIPRNQTHVIAATYLRGYLR